MQWANTFLVLQQVSEARGEDSERVPRPIPDVQKTSEQHFVVSGRRIKNRSRLLQSRVPGKKKKKKLPNIWANCVFGTVLSQSSQPLNSDTM